jgi:site-specific recombinase XerD
MGKGRKGRIVKMGDKTQKALLQYLLMRNDSLDCLWVTDNGEPLGEWGIVSAIRRIAERAAVPKGMKHGTHVYRHTGATNYLRNKGSVKCLQEMLGHVHIETTMKYVDALGPAALIADHIYASPVDNLLGGRC